MPKPTVPSAADTAKKWADVTPGRAGYYERNTPGAAGKWESNAGLAAKTFQAAVSAGDISKRFAGGIKKAGAAKFSRKVTSVGVGRYGPGVTAAQPDMESGVGPYLAEIGNIELAERGPRGDATNYSRVQKIGDALHKKRLASLAAGA